MLNHLFLCLNLKMMGLEGKVYTWKIAKKLWVVTFLDESPFPQPLPYKLPLRIFMFQKKKKKLIWNWHRQIMAFVGSEIDDSGVYIFWWSLTQRFNIYILQGSIDLKTFCPSLGSDLFFRLAPGSGSRNGFTVWSVFFHASQKRKCLS